MREIKFRAWLTNGEGITYSNGDHMEYDITVQNGKYADVEYGCDIHGLYDYPIMQYTGLKDKNGVDIYEGDIVEDHYFKNSVSRHKVYWADNYGCWSTINLKDPIIDRKQLGYFNEAKNLHRNEYLEVIGNIYENPSNMVG